MVPRQLIENCIIIWLNPNIDFNEQEKVIPLFHQISNEVRIFQRADSCIDYMSELTEEHILFIVSEDIGAEIVPLVHQLSQIDSIFLFSLHEQPEWMSQIRKFKGITSNIESLCDMLKSNVRLIERDNITFDVVSNALSSDNRNKQEATFMYTQLLKDIFLVMKDDNRDEMIEFCRTQYAGNVHELRLIDEFERNYESNQSINWYTRESFLYKMINKALRTQNIETLYKIRTFIRNLHLHLLECYEKQRDNLIIRMLYRGQRMSNDEFEKIKQNKGGLLSISNFFSTSEDKSLAEIYAGVSNNEETAMIFEIETDQCLAAVTSPFANIQEFSHFGQQEKEWLFSLGSVFRIDNIVQGTGNDPWCIRLSLTNEFDEQLKGIMEHFRNDILIGFTLPIRSLAKLSFKMGNYKSALEYYQMALESETFWRSRSLILHELGNTNELLGSHDKALSYYEQALELEQKNSGRTIDSHRLAEIYMGLASVYSNMQEKDRSLNYLRDALKTELSIEIPNKETLKNIYNDIAVILYSKKQYDEALRNYGKALDICMQIYPTTHPDIGVVHMSIANVYQGQGRNKDALEAFRKSLDIQLASLPPDHPDIARSYNNISALYCSLGLYEDGLVNCERALDIYLKRMPANHPNLVVLYGNMIRIYNNLHKLEESLDLQRKKLDILLATLQTDDPTIGGYYNILAGTLCALRRFDEALEYAQKAVDLTTKVFGKMHPSTEICVNNLKEIYNRMS